MTLTGPGAAHVKVLSVVLTGNGQPQTVAPQWVHTHLAGPPYPGYAPHPTRFPYRAPAGSTVWITAQVRLISCGPVSVNTLSLHYSMLGINTIESIPLQDPLRMRCRP